MAPPLPHSQRKNAAALRFTHVFNFVTQRCRGGRDAEKEANKSVRTRRGRVPTSSPVGAFPRNARARIRCGSATSAAPAHCAKPCGPRADPRLENPKFRNPDAAAASRLPGFRIVGRRRCAPPVSGGRGWFSRGARRRDSGFRENPASARVKARATATPPLP